MIRPATVLCLLGSLWSPCVGGQEEVDPRAGTPLSIVVDRTEVRLVEVEVFVRDRKGRAIDDLELADFIVRVGGETVVPSHFLPPRQTTIGGPDERGTAEVPPYEQETVVVPLDLAATRESQALTEASAGASEDETRLVVFYVDHLAIQPHSRRRVLDRAGEFLASLESREEHANLRFLVVTYHGTLRVAQTLTEDPTRVAAALAGELELAGPALARWSERQALMREGMQVLQTIGMANRARSPSQINSLRNLAESQLGTLMRQVELYAEQLRQETLRGVTMLEGFVGALAALRGRKALVHVSDGLPLRPGEELFWAMEEIFQGGRQLEFADGTGESGGATGGGAGAGGATGGGGSAGGGAFASRERINTVSFLTRAQRFDLTSAFRRLAAVANRHRVSFYPLDAGGRRVAEAAVDGRLGPLTRGGLEAMADSNHQAPLELLAESTGGDLLTGAALEPFLESLIDDFDRAYLLAWPVDAGTALSDPSEAKARPLTIKVRRPGAKVRTRRSLLAVDDGEQHAQRLRSALFLGLESNPQQIELVFGRPGPGGEGERRTLPLEILIPFDHLVLLPRGASHVFEGRLRLATNSGLLEEIPLSLDIPNEALASTAGQVYTVELELPLASGEERLAIAFWDSLAGQGSWIARDLPKLEE